jgi:hypothetical protein
MVRKFSLISLAIVLPVTVILLFVQKATAAGPKLGCKPYFLTVKTGQTFYFTVAVTETVDLYAWQFDMNYNKNYLEFLRVVPGKHLRVDGVQYYFVKPITVTVGTTTNEVRLAAYTRLAADQGVDGSGAIAHVFFRAKSPTSGYNLTLNDTKLVNRNALDVTYGAFNSFQCRVVISNSASELKQENVGEVSLVPMILR